MPSIGEPRPPGFQKEVFFSRNPQTFPHGEIQLVSWDPTPYRRAELTAEVRKMDAAGFEPTLMAHGRIGANRDLWEELVDAGLKHVGFHVDVTHPIKGYACESELNLIRARYIERVRDLPISVTFHTKVSRENLKEIPDVVHFFRQNADVVDMACFHLSPSESPIAVSFESLRSQIKKGAQTELSWQPGKLSAASWYTIVFAANEKLYDLGKAPKEVWLELEKDGWNTKDCLSSLLTQWRQQPRNMPRSLYWLGRLAWQMRHDLVVARGKIHRLLFTVDFAEPTSQDRTKTLPVI